jgi:hypothetical protein
LTTHQLVTRSRIRGYIHPPIRLHGLVLNYLNKGVISTFFILVKTSGYFLTGSSFGGLNLFFQKQLSLLLRVNDFNHYSTTSSYDGYGFEPFSYPNEVFRPGK